MLSGFRRGGVTQVFLGGIVFLIIGAFAFDFRGNSGSLDTECAARVNGACVPPREFNAAFRMTVRPELTAKQIRRLGLRQMVMDGLVERELLLGVAEQWGIGVSDEALDKELSLGRFHFSLPAERDGLAPMLTYVNVRHPKTEKFNYDIYKRMVRNYARMSGKDFREYQTREVTAARVRDAIKNSVRVSEAEAFSQYEYTRTRITTRAGLLSREWFARFLTPLSEAEVDAYIAANTETVENTWKARSEAFSPGCQLVQEITFRFPPAADPEDEAATKALASEVHRQVRKADADRFGRFARLHGDGEAAWNGGYRGCLDAKDDASAALLKALEGKPDGFVTDVLDVSGGVRIARSLGKLPESEEAAQPLAKRLVARPMALRAAADARLEQFAKALIDAAGKGEALQAAVDRLTQEQLDAQGPSLDLPTRSEVALKSKERPRVDVSASFTRTDRIQPIVGTISEVPVKQLAFALEKIDSLHSEPIPTREGLSVLQLKDRSDVTREAFESEKAEVIQEIKSRSQSAALVRFVARLREKSGAKIVQNPAFLDPPEGAEEDS